MACTRLHSRSRTWTLPYDNGVRTHGCGCGPTKDENIACLCDAQWGEQQTSRLGPRAPCAFHSVPTFLDVHTPIHLRRRLVLIARELLHERTASVGPGTTSFFPPSQFRLQSVAVWHISSFPDTVTHSGKLLVAAETPKSHQSY